MINSRTIFMGILLAIMVFGLTGCIVSTSPNTEDVIVMNPGESKVFKVSGVNLNTPTTKCVWAIYREFETGNPDEVFEGTDHVEFTVSPEGEKSNRVIITCSFLKWMQVYVAQTGTMWQWVTIQKRSWYICIPRNTAPVWQGDYYIADSTDVQMLNAYTEITGALYIYNSNLKRLEGLENLTSVSGGLYIYGNPTLTSLSGLGNLASVGGLIIDGNAALKNLSGLENLTSVSGDLEIYYNAALTSLSGLESLTSVGSNLYIVDNFALTSLSGIENVTSVGGGLDIEGNRVLKNLSDHQNITSVGGYLSIYNNRALTSLSGLENLTSIGGSLSIEYNNALTSLSGLENLTSVGGGLYIVYNDALTSLEMAGLQRVDGDFSISYNPLLCTSLAEELRDQVLAGGGIGGTRTINGNKTCSTP